MRGPLSAVLVSAALACAVGGCGRKGDLRRPQSARSVPVPYGRDQPPTTASQMTPPPQAAPERNVELLIRSQPRPDDPFDLPPK